MDAIFKQRDLKVFKSIDFSKGFSSWIAQISVPKRRNANGTYQGEMMFSTPYRNRSDPGRDLRYSWKMRFEICVGAELADGVKFELESETPEIVPFVYRMVITDSDGRELLELCDFQILCATGYEMKKLSKHIHFSESCVLNKINNIVLWIYMPKLLTRRQYNQPPDSVGRGSGAENLLRSVMAKQRNVDDDETDDFSDVDLVLVDADGNECRRYPCHRAILSGASSVFKRLLLKRPASEATSDSTAGSSVKRAFNMRNINEEAMKRLLEYIYVGRVPKCTDDFDDESLFQLINAAEEYDLPILKEECEFICLLRMKSQLHDHPYHRPNHPRRFDPNSDPGSNRNSLKMLRVADLYKLDRLKAVCMRQLSASITLINKKRKEGLISDALYDEMIEFYQLERGKMKPVIIDNTVE